MQKVDNQTTTEEKVAEDKLFNFRPLFFFAVFLALGIVFGFYSYLYDLSFWWWLILLPVGFVVIVIKRYNRLNACIAVLALIIAFLIGAGSFHLQVTNYTDAEQYSGKHVAYGRVIERVKGENGCLLRLDTLKIDNEKRDGTLIVYLPSVYYNNVQLADEIRVEGEIENEKLFNVNGFKASILYDDVRYRINVESVEDCTIIGRKFNLFLSARQQIERTLINGMDETSASVMIAVLLGDTTLMENGLLQNVRYSGIAHVFAVSGLHIGVLFGFCLWIISRTPLQKTRKPIRFVITALILLLYGGVCGYSASVVRAIIMCLVFYYGKLTGFSFDGLSGIGLAGSIVMLLSPVSLLSVGFQLSFSACLGISLLNKGIFNAIDYVGCGIICKCKKCTREAYEDDKLDRPLHIPERIYKNAISFLSVSLSAQITTAPLLLYYFGYLSVFSLAINCIFVPIISGLFSILLVLSLLASVLPATISGIVLYLPSIIWSALLLPFQAFHFSLGIVENVPVNVATIVCYYIAILFVTDKWNIPKRLNVILFSLFVFTFLVGSVLLYFI